MGIVDNPDCYVGDYLHVIGGAMGAALGRLLAGLLSSAGIQSTVLRYFLLGLFMSGITIAVYNGVVGLISDMMSWAFTRASSGNTTGSLQSISVAGPTAYLIYKLNIYQLLPAFVSAFTIRIGLKAIPFIKLN